MNQRAIFYMASQCLRTTCPSCGNNWLSAGSAALAALFRVLVLALLTWLLAGVLTLLALSRILVLLTRLLALLTAALVALLILLVLVWILLVCHRLVLHFLSWQ